MKFIAVFLLWACTTPCDEINQNFKSYSEANSAVKSASWVIVEDLNTSKSSWLRKATYYSCDELTGYLIIKTDSNEYIHEGVPIEIWNGFKQATSFGKYYDQYIRYKYPLELN